MTMAKHNGYIHVSAFRVLYVLALLVHQRALTHSEINRCMAEHPMIERVFGAETITKYINTLRVFGCDIPKANGKQQFQYRLEKAPFPVDLSEAHVQLLIELNRLLSGYPDDQLHVQFLKFFEHVLWSSKLQGRYQHHTLTTLLDGEQEGVCTGQEVVQVRKFKKWCRERQALTIHYGQSIEELRVYYLDLLDVIQEEGISYVLGYDRDLMQQVRLDMSLIRQVRQLPCKVQNRLRWVNVQFQLTGRLAKTYRLYADETILSRSINESGDVKRLIVRARTLEPDLLLNRLMKYAPWCEVLSPQYIRQKANNKIETLLNVHYQMEPLSSASVDDLLSGISR